MLYGRTEGVLLVPKVGEFIESRIALGSEIFAPLCCSSYISTG